MSRQKTAKRRPSPAPLPTKPAPGIFVRRRVPRWVVWSVVGLCLAALTAVGYLAIYPQVKGFVYWRQAAAAVQELDFEQARHDYEICATIWPDSGETQFLLARTCRRQGDFLAAHEHLRAARQHHWLEEQVSLEGLLLHTQAGAVKASEANLRRELDQGHPDSKLILEALVVGSLQVNLLNDAYHWASAWCKNYPDDWEGHYWQGNVLLAGLSLDKAAEEFEQSLKLHPGFTEAELKLGNVLRRRGRTADAVPHLRAVLAKQVDNPAALLDLARCDRTLNHPEEGRKLLNRVLILQSDNADALRLRAQFEMDDDNATEALQDLERANSLDPNDRDTITALADACRRLKRLDEAPRYEAQRQALLKDYHRLEEITQEVARDPQAVQVRYEAAAILRRLDRQQQALPWLMSILQIDPTQTEARAQLIDLAHKLNDPQLSQALERLQAQNQPSLQP